MIIGKPVETFPGERRGALAPETVEPLTRKGIAAYAPASAGVESTRMKLRLDGRRSDGFIPHAFVFIRF